VGITVEGLKETLIFRIRTTLLALLTAVGVVWLIVCADVASLSMVRSTTRTREFATRAALGAGSARLARQSIAESVLMVVLGGCLGGIIGVTALRWARGSVPAEILGNPQTGFDLRVAGFVLALSGLVVIVCGLVSTRRTALADLVESLRDGHRGSTGRGQAALAFFVVTQMSLAMVLLIGAGLMIRSLTNLWAVNPGFDPQSVITFQYGLDAPARPTVYVNLFQRPRAAMTVTMLSDADTQSVTAAARGILRNLDAEVPAQFRTFSQIYSASLGSRRFNVTLIGFFGLTALLLATSGVFGVMAYSVSRRTREIGVRIALGAVTGDVLKMILAQALGTIFIGVAVGLAGALVLTRAVESLLFGVTATDPLTFGGVTVLLVGTALLACYIPARRATKIDPMVALRYE